MSAKFQRRKQAQNALPMERRRAFCRKTEELVIAVFTTHKVDWRKARRKTIKNIEHIHSWFKANGWLTEDQKKLVLKVYSMNMKKVLGDGK